MMRKVDLTRLANNPMAIFVVYIPFAYKMNSHSLQALKAEVDNIRTFMVPAIPREKLKTIGHGSVGEVILRCFYNAEECNHTE